MLFTTHIYAQGIELNGTISAEDNQIKNLQDPTDAQDAVTLSVLLEKISALQGQISALQATTGSGTVTDIDGNSYAFLTYGNQVWTVENAEVVTYRDGTSIPQVTANDEWESLTTGAWCYYENDETKGKLYNWYAVMGIHDAIETTPNKEFAPEGWHVPSDAEWTTLEDQLIAYGYNCDGTITGNKIAQAMASIGWSASTVTGSPGNYQSANNDSGFNAYPLGYRGYLEQGSFVNNGNQALFWSSSSFNDVLGWYFRLSFQFEFSDLTMDDSIWKQGGMQVRFVRD